ncbi:MAG: hypothetical protein KDD47_05810 [Acidobacteria bacterium]|nr:hypothetical protein [Acidobacteriota bacterium]
MEPKRTVHFTVSATSSLFGVWIASTLMQRVPGVTLIDAGALLVTGVLAGLFLGLGLGSR